MVLITLTIAGAVATVGGVAGLTAWLRRLWRATALRAPIINDKRVLLPGYGPGEYVIGYDDDMDAPDVIMVNDFTEYYETPLFCGPRCEDGSYSIFAVSHWDRVRNNFPSVRGPLLEDDSIAILELDDSLAIPEVVEPPPTVRAPKPPPRDVHRNTGRKLAKVCGESVRRGMGYPKRTPANYSVACQRCDAWLKDNCPDLRQKYYSMVHAKAVFHALVPTRVEIESVGELMSESVARGEHYVTSKHMLRDRRVPKFVADMMGLYEPSTGDF